MFHRVSRDLGAAAAELPVWRHVSAVLRAIREITTAAGDDEFHLRLARNLAEALGCHTAFVAQLVRRNGGARVRTVAVWSRGEAAENFDYPLAGTPCEEVLRTGFLQIERDVAQRFPDDRILGAIRAESYLGAALVGSDGEPVGHLAALDDRPILGEESNESVLRIFAARAAADLDRRNVEGRLRDVEGNFRLLFEQSPNAIILYDPQTWKPIEFNDLAAELMGYTRDEFAELTITDLELTPNPEETRDHVASILESGGDVFEALHKGKDGGHRHVIVSLRATVWKGRQVMLTLWHDITTRKSAEQALEASERRLRSIFDSAMDAVVIVDGEFKIIRLNPAAERLFQCQADAVVGRLIQRYFPGAVFDRLLSQARDDGHDDGSRSV